VELPDGSPGTIRADATDILGTETSQELPTVLSIEGIRQLRALVKALAPPRRSTSSSKTRK